LSSNNYYNPYDNKIVRYPTSTVSSLVDNNNNKDLVAQVSIVPITSYNKDINIYCRFGNSMAYNITYESVSLKLT
jgi:hypothetical protein